MASSGLKNVLQLLGTSFIVVFGLSLTVVIFTRFFPDNLPLWIVGPLLVAGFFVFVVVGRALFHGQGPR